jgi:hypothetical protein
MNFIIKTTLKTTGLVLLFAAMLSSCKKDNMTYNAYFYSMQDLQESSATLTVDGKDYGAIFYHEVGTVTAQTPLLNLVKLQSGRHEIRVYDQNKKNINSCYVDFGANSLGAGSSGTAGGESDCRSNDSQNIFIGLSNKALATQ